MGDTESVIEMVEINEGARIRGRSGERVNRNQNDVNDKGVD